MTLEGRTRRTPGLRVAAAAALVAALTAGPGVGPTAAAGTGPLALGAADLAESLTTRVLAPGVDLTQVVRGDGPAAEDAIGTTQRGPWRVAVLRVDPRVATGRLVATYGPDLAGSETTSSLVGGAGALAGVNASFFTYVKNPAFPGDPVGLGLYDGHLLSEPAATSTEVDVLLDARRGTVRFGRLTWSGRLRNPRTKRSLALERLNSPPVVPKGCARLDDPRTCTRSGDVVRFDPAFAASTPKGPGAEVVLDHDGCVVRSTRRRGRRLTAGQTSVQATGRQTKTLLTLAKKGCLSTRIVLRDDRDEVVTTHPGLYGVAGRFRLVRDGKVVVKTQQTDFFERHPRTVVGTTKSGVVALVTIDGTQTTSVGVTLKEAARVARSLGLTDAVNLDGGGSTTMVASGRLVNRPSHDGVERAVGDALVYVPGPPG